MAMLEHAIRDACGHGVLTEKGGATSSRKITGRARRWIWTWDEEYAPPFSFPWICEHLHLCPYTVRRISNQFIRGKRKLPDKIGFDHREFLHSICAEYDSEFSITHEVQPPKRKAG